MALSIRSTKIWVGKCKSLLAANITIEYDGFILGDDLIDSLIEFVSDQLAEEVAEVLSGTEIN